MTSELKNSPNCPKTNPRGKWARRSLAVVVLDDAPRSLCIVLVAHHQCRQYGHRLLELGWAEVRPKRLAELAQSRIQANNRLDIALRAGRMVCRALASRSHLRRSAPASRRRNPTPMVGPRYCPHHAALVGVVFLGYAGRSCVSLVRSACCRPAVGLVCQTTPDVL
jgi:hypothetical protein